MISKVEITFTNADIEDLLKKAAPNEIRADSGYCWSPKNITWKADGSAVIELEKKTLNSSFYDR